MPIYGLQVGYCYKFRRRNFYNQSHATYLGHGGALGLEDSDDEDEDSGIIENGLKVPTNRSRKLSIKEHIS